MYRAGTPRGRVRPIAYSRWPSAQKIPSAKAGPRCALLGTSARLSFCSRPRDPERPESFEKTGSYFFKGLDTLGVRYERIAVPYGAASLRALYFPGPRGAETKPLIMFGGGFDSILEEYYPNFAEAALKRGYPVLTYEGPGQGEALRKYGLTYTAEWEKPVTAVLDEFLHTHAKPSKIVLIGMSMGGYFAPRAAAFEERIDGVVAYDTCYDFSEVAGRLLAAAKNPLAMKNPDVSWAYHNALWTMGTKDVDETIKACAAYTLAPVADRIRQDVLMLAGTEDHFIPFHQTADFEKALVNARSVTTSIFDGHSPAISRWLAYRIAIFVSPWASSAPSASPKPGSSSYAIRHKRKDFTEEPWRSSNA